MATKIKLLIAQYRLPFPLYYSGAEKSTLELAMALVEKKVDLTMMFNQAFISDKNFEAMLINAGLHYQKTETGFHYTYKNIAINIYNNAIFFEKYSSFLSQYPEAFILHQRNLFAKSEYEKKWYDLFSNGKNHVYFVRSEDSLNPLKKVHKSIKHIIVNSNYMKTEVKKQLNRSSVVLYPSPHEECIAKNKQEFSNYITFFNPVNVKGAAIIEWLIKNNPQRYFMIILGWDKVNEMTIDLKKYKRVLVVPSQENVAEIYSYSRLVLIPSQWEEAFGRVHIEAAMNKIPAIISARGGLKEHFCGNGILVKDYSNPQAWQDALDYLDDPSNYQKAVTKTDEIRKQFSIKKEASKLLQALK